MKILQFRHDRDVDDATPLVNSHLAAGGLLAYPTETVYGLGSRPQPNALSALTAIKRRDPNSPFIILVSTRTMAEEWGLEFTDTAVALARQFWPGPLTLVLEVGGDKLPDSLRGPSGGIAVRCTSLQTVARLIENIGYPITSTSANRSGEPPACDIRAIDKMFGDDPKLLTLDGGELRQTEPSTVVDCTADNPSIVREGAIPLSLLRSHVGSLVR